MVENNTPEETPAENIPKEGTLEGGAIEDDAVDKVLNQENKPTEDSPGSGTDSKEGLKDSLGKILGKEFKDDETALKSVKDTFDFVGKAGKANAALKAVMESEGLTEDQAVDFIKNSTSGSKKESDQEKPEIDTSKFVPREEFEEKNFYNDNPDYKPYKKLVETFKKANPDKSREEIVQLEDFKENFTKVESHDKTKKQKSVLMSNPKLGTVKDKMTEARESQSKGDQESAETKAAEGVIEAFDI